MDKPTNLMKTEINILFQALCDGLRQEVRQRYLAQLVTKRDFSLVDEQELGLVSSLSLHLRSIGFPVNIDSYFEGGSSKRRPDVRIWLPASAKYIYLEVKMTAWGRGWYYYDRGVISDIEKLNSDTDPQNQLNGLIALGFSRPHEKKNQLLAKSKELSGRITKKYPYEEIGMQQIDLEPMDARTSYAVISLWFHKA